MNALAKHEGSALSLADENLMLVLQSSLYPGASLPSIRLVLDYCKAAGLDPMQKPVYIVPMWDSKSKQTHDVVMPGIGLYRTQAARNGHAGTSEPEYGPEQTETIGGQQIKFPSWCRITVKRRQPCGAVDEFVAVEYWIENYAEKGGPDKSIAPNKMWAKRPRGQIAKCAEAQALRKAFPELGAQPTADEMEGRQVHPEDASTVIDAPPPPPPPAWSDANITARIPKWRGALAAGQTHDAIVAFARSKGALTAAQEQTICALTPTPKHEPPNGDDHSRSDGSMQASTQGGAS